MHFSHGMGVEHTKNLTTLELLNYTKNFQQIFIQRKTPICARCHSQPPSIHLDVHLLYLMWLFLFIVLCALVDVW